MRPLVPRPDHGYAMAALLVALSIMGIMLGMALPAWRTWVQREREAELIFRGEQYAQAINLFSRRTGGFPTSFDALRDGRYIRRLYKDPITNGDFQPVFLGQVGPLTPPVVPGARGAGPAPGPGGAPPARQGGPGRGSQPAASPFPTQAGRAGQPGALGQSGTPGAGPIIGVVSRSTGESMRLYNGRGRYNEWLFVSTAATQQPGVPQGAGPPGPGGRGPQPPGARGRGGAPPGRGQQPGSPFNQPAQRGRGPGGFQPNPFGRPGGPGTGPNQVAPNPITPGRQ
jgi:type II secretory pathway pseudopilin PulG